MPIQHWELRGRLAVRADERGGQASLTWKRDAARHSIRLNGPLGRGVVRVTQDETGAQLQDAEQRVFHAADAEELLYRYTGWRLPLTNLNYWVRGVPVPGLPATGNWMMPAASRRCVSRVGSSSIRNMCASRDMSCPTGSP